MPEHGRSDSKEERQVSRCVSECEWVRGMSEWVSDEWENNVQWLQYVCESLCDCSVWGIVTPCKCVWAKPVAFRHEAGTMLLTATLHYQFFSEVNEHPLIIHSCSDSETSRCDNMDSSTIMSRHLPGQSLSSLPPNPSLPLVPKLPDVWDQSSSPPAVNNTNPCDPASSWYVRISFNKLIVS